MQGITDRRRPLAFGVVALVAALGLSACFPVAPDPAPRPPRTANAGTHTWRAATESAAGHAHQALHSTAATAATRRAWADEVIRGMSWTALLTREAAATGASAQQAQTRASSIVASLHLAGHIPAPMRLGIAGDSVAFSLAFNRGGAIGPVSGDNGGARIGCGVMHARNWLRQRADGSWVRAADGRCDLAIGNELTAAAKSDVMLWVAGSWEFDALRSPGGTVVAARSSRMAQVLTNEMVARIDSWTARGVRRVVLADWGCPGSGAPVVLRDPAYRQWFRQILDEVARRRPSVASVTVAPREVCSPDGWVTATADRLRGDHHWPTSQAGRWGWSVWYSPALADLPLPPA
jgi:hypothetical protein